MKARVLAIFGAAAIVSLVACGGGDDADEVDADATVVDTTTPVVTPPPAPVTPDTTGMGGMTDTTGMGGMTDTTGADTGAAATTTP